MKRLMVGVAATAAIAFNMTAQAPAPKPEANPTLTALAAAKEVARTLPGRERAAAIERGRIVIDLVDGTPASEIAAMEKQYGLDLEPVSRLSEQDGLETAAVPVGRESAVLEQLANDPRVEVAEPSFIYRALYQPNDPRFNEQWHMKMIKAPEAWDITQGQGVTVAVIDTGIAYENHNGFYQVEDLKGIEFVAPFNFVANKDHANDDHGHGTHVAGTIAQATNNGVGVAGVAYKVKLMPLKVLAANGGGSIGPIAQSIRWAADKGAKVINMSLGGPFPSRVLEQACDYAKKKGVLVVCAAGNDGREKISYPAAYASCVSVSAVRPDGVLSWYSNYGKGLHIAAPGGDTRWGGAAAGVLQNCINPSNITEQGYYAFQGTSMACPHVAGAAALVMSTGITDPDKVLKILQETADKKEDTRRYGAGIVDCLAAVKKAKAEVQAEQLGAGLSLALLALLPLGMAGALRALKASWKGFAIGALSAALFAPAASVAAFGAEHHVTTLSLAAPAALVLVLLFSGFTALRGLLAGAALGVAAYLVTAATVVAPTFTCGTWMITQALFLTVLGSLVLRRQTREEKK